MAERSIIFDFRRTPNFIKNMNQSGCFNVNGMDGTTQNYEFVLASACEDNIEDNLNNDGTLKNSAVTTINVGTSGRVALKFANIGGNNCTISLPATDTTVTIGNVDVYLKGLFLKDRTSGYVIAYAILTKRIPITNQMVFPKDKIVWTIKNESS